MMNITNCSIRALTVAVRWARMQGFPNALADLTEEHNRQIQAVADEYDRRHHTHKK